MMINPDWLFVSTMKCATNSLYAALPETGATRHGRGFHPRPSKRLRPLQWTVVRNPYDRAVSIWASTCLRHGDRYKAKARIRSVGGDPESFDDFVAACLANGHWRGYYGDPETARAVGKWARPDWGLPVAEFWEEP